ncbi:methyltransferase domain-containing protein [Streptomyces noursei]|nr:methyltransferase domain-containing protein [Streptomyces noursei]
MSDPLRPRASLRTAVVWDVLKDALERRVKAAGRDALDVLDTGGGSGNFAVPVARLGHRVTVVDPSPNALFALERRAAEAGVADRIRGVRATPTGCSRSSSAVATTRCSATACWSTSTTRPRACATPSARSAPPAP